jgi:purine-nucleoside phosphorylase
MVPTPHISAQLGDFADVVLMPGDPLRAKMIAETYLTDAKLVTNVRNMLGYTGYYQGRRISVMAHGMGIPSCSIYVTELVRFYGVKTVIRIGSCGGVAEDVKLHDIILAQAACTDSNMNRQRFMGFDYAASADFGLMQQAVLAAQEHDIALRVGTIHSSDFFYNADSEQQIEVFKRMNVLAVEMELAGIYAICAEHGARGLGFLTVSDHIVTGEHLNAADRQNTFQRMVQLALTTALKIPAL